MEGGRSEYGMEREKEVDMARPKRPPWGTTELPGGGKMIYDGDLTVLDKDGELVSWVSSDLLEVLWGEEGETEEKQNPDGEEQKNNGE